MIAFVRPALFLALLAGPAVAEPAADGGASKAKDLNKLICRSEQVTGTRFAKKICLTQAQRDEQAERDRQNLSDMAMKSPLNSESGTK